MQPSSLRGRTLHPQLPPFGPKAPVGRDVGELSGVLGPNRSLSTQQGVSFALPAAEFCQRVCDQRSQGAGRGLHQGRAEESRRGKLRRAGGVERTVPPASPCLDQEGRGGKAQRIFCITAGGDPRQAGG